MIENLKNIRIGGLDGFLRNEEEKWKCKVCGVGLSVHRDFCINCKAKTNKNAC
jgi:uncharacterized OB-fold protein